MFFHSFVLYAGKRITGGNHNWMEGIVIHEENGSDGALMCEVLYINGWVIWHKFSSFVKISDKKRTTLLMIAQNLPQMVRFLLNLPTDMSDEDVMVQWMMDEMDIFSQCVELSPTGRRKTVSSRKQQSLRLWKGIVDAYPKILK